MKRTAVAVVGFLTLAGLIGFIVRLPSGGGGGAEKAADISRGVAAPSASPAPAEGIDQAGPTTANTTTTVVGGTFTGGGGVSGGGTGTTAGSAPIGAPPQVSLPAIGGIAQNELVGPRVIETAQLSLLVKRDGFDRAFDRATQIASAYGGFVQTSSTEGVRSQFGHLTIRVDAGSFNAALRDLRALGRVTGQSISGQDVTSQFVDLQARLRNWQAQEKALLRLMGRATSVGDTLRIQNELSQVQLRVEELKGQLRVLDNQTSLATIDVSMRESGATVEPSHEKSEWTLAQAWDDARHGFVGVLAAVVVGLGYLIPITALLALVWLGVRRLRPAVVAREGIADRLRTNRAGS